MGLLWQQIAASTCSRASTARLLGMGLCLLLPPAKTLRSSLLLIYKSLSQGDDAGHVMGRLVAESRAGVHRIPPQNELPGNDEGELLVQVALEDRGEKTQRRGPELHSHNRRNPHASQPS